MKVLFCVRCNKKHTSIDGWSHRKWQTKKGEVEGWGCWSVKQKEYIPQSIKDGRKQYRKELTQSFREGQFSKEYRDYYPDQAKKMVQEGIITQRQHDNAKQVWHNEDL